MGQGKGQGRGAGQQAADAGPGAWACALPPFPTFVVHPSSVGFLAGPWDQVSADVREIFAGMAPSMPACIGHQQHAACVIGPLLYYTALPAIVLPFANSREFHTDITVE